MLNKIDHLGIAVHSLAETVPFYEEALGLTASPPEEVPSQMVRIVFFDVGGTHLELLEPTSPESPIAKFLASRGPGIHHIAFGTDDVVAQLARAKGAGCRVIHETPIEGGNDKLVAFLHPKSSHGVLMEFCQPTSTPTGAKCSDPT